MARSYFASAYRLECSNGGAPEIDGETSQSIENGEGEAKFLSKLQQELKEKRATDRSRSAGLQFADENEGTGSVAGIH
jgi:hypothetical protein